MKTKSTPEPGELRERALRLLARREHSRAELARKLEQAGFTVDDINPLLSEFEDKNWLSDRRFAESWVADHLAKSGRVKLAYDLHQRGVPDDIIEAVLNSTRDSELERAREVWRKKFGTTPTDASERARQTRFLLGRGFTSEAVWEVLAHQESSR